MADTPYKTHQWRELRPHIYERDQGTCQVCEHPHPVPPDDYDVDHIIPWREGGAWFDPANLRLSCPPANRGRASTRVTVAARINTQPATTPSRKWR